ncbi:MAG: mannose-1-phosphate guanylyltransferase/mannose-6-phosphate isomerase [Burkholderiales bacterium]|nr:mannose-1-phosphate guanylyltransferase/mannose-6-phosphate isomerase [Burkholderiales bacterium]
MDTPVSDTVILPAAGPVPASRRYAVILAGGSGTRLWPLSRAAMPKQLLALDGKETLLQQTARRLAPRVEPARVVTVTHADHRFEVAGQLHAVDARLADGVLAEPMGRNTLPAIAWAAARIARDAPDAVVGVFSSDHAVADSAAFLAAWQAAEAAAEAGCIALFGMRPTEPATGYGYIEAGDFLPAAAPGVRRVARFVEKPDLETAKGFLARGNYFWNGGMFVFRADRFLATLERCQPALHAALPALAGGERFAPAKAYRDLPNTSIDYGVLEHADNVAVVPVEMGWSDLGGWDALYRQRAKDEAGNVTQGDVVHVNSRNNLLWSDHGTLATLGLENMAVVQTRDATLVCQRDQAADLKVLVARLKEDHPDLTETHLTVARPWGSYTTLEEGHRYKIKRIVVNPGAKLSLQMHHHRSEHWVVIAGTARIVNGDQEMYLEENQSTYIPKTHRHRLENPGKIPLQIIEIQSGPYLEEDDIVRFGDVYGRA